MGADLGDWHLVALDSSIDVSAGSAQARWLRSDLADSTPRDASSPSSTTRGSAPGGTTTAQRWTRAFCALEARKSGNESGTRMRMCVLLVAGMGYDDSSSETCVPTGELDR